MQQIYGIALITLFASVSSLSASTVLLDEHFLDNSLSNGSNSGETDTAWYSYNNNSGGSAYTTNTDSGGLMSGNVMRNTAGSASNTLAIGSFSSVTLTNTGDWIKLTFDYRITTADASKRMFYGLFNDGGTAVTSNEFGVTNSTSADDVGYNLMKYLNDSTAATVYRRDATTGNKSINDTLTSIGTIASSATLTNNTVHTVELTITRQDNTLIIATNIDNTGAGSTIVTSPITYTFNEVGLSANPGSNGFLWDNIVITAGTAAIPEPAAVGLIGTGAAVGILSLRNKR